MPVSYSISCSISTIKFIKNSYSDIQNYIQSIYDYQLFEHKFHEFVPHLHPWFMVPYPPLFLNIKKKKKKKPITASLLLSILPTPRMATQQLHNTVSFKNNFFFFDLFSHLYRIIFLCYLQYTFLCSIFRPLLSSAVRRT